MDRTTGCKVCPLSTRSLCAHLARIDESLLAGSVIHRRYAAGQAIGSRGLMTGSLAVVAKGTVKLVKTSSAGKHQIVGLKFAGDILTDTEGDARALVVEAANEVELCWFTETLWRDLTARYPNLVQSRLERHAQELAQSRDWLFALGHLSANERVAWFLDLIYEGSNRRTSTAPQSDTVLLPISRREMADCLGLRLETVSRQMKAFKDMGLIEIARTRRIRILNRAALRRRGALRAITGEDRPRAAIPLIAGS